ncbi:hypothetical protein MASR1M32_31950 [Rhodobacter sp.]
MEALSSVRPAVQTLGTPPQTAGTDPGSSTAQNGARAEFAVAPEIAQALAPAAGAARTAMAGDQALPDGDYVVESAKARALAAQRAYEMASLVAGLNPLNDPVP